jgi:hypothetical protein
MIGGDGVAATAELVRGLGVVATAAINARTIKPDVKARVILSHPLVPVEDEG